MIENQFYHIYNRGNNKENIFFEDKNYIYFLDKFYSYLKEYVSVYSFCLMPNHFHFLIKIKPYGQKNNMLLEPNKLTPIEKSFRDFFISYAKSINKAYNRTGSLFQYKFKRKLINDENSLRRVTAYIHLNPVRAGIVNDLTEYSYNSFSAICSPSQNKYIIERDEVVSWYGDLEYLKEFHNTYNQHVEDRKFIFES